MKWFVIVLFALICGCQSEGPVQASSGQWSSLSQLECIAKHYAGQHKIGFDFAGAQPEIYTVTNTFAEIVFDGGSQGLLAVRIGRSGAVMDCTIFTTPNPTNIITRYPKPPIPNTSGANADPT
ncbi:MAG: hypothetical protein ACREDQ_11340 [Limisphaerales bacterium]